MDELDKQIITLLKENGRRPFVEIGKEVNLSEAAVRRRVQNLVKASVIKRFTVEVNMGGANAIALISVNPSTPTPSVSEGLRKVKGVDVVYEITGQYDIAVIISAPNIAEINRCIDDIRRVQGVGNTNTVIILRALR